MASILALLACLWALLAALLGFLGRLGQLFLCATLLFLLLGRLGCDLSLPNVLPAFRWSKMKISDPLSIEKVRFSLTNTVLSRNSMVLHSDAISVRFYADLASILAIWARFWTLLAVLLRFLGRLGHLFPRRDAPFSAPRPSWT